MTTLRIDPGSLYWATLDVPVGASRRDTEPLRYAFEPWLPAPLHDIEARFVRLRAASSRGATKWLACGIERERLRAFIDGAEAERRRGIESVIPAAVPAWVAERAGVPLAQLDCATFEFRTGALTSARERRRRRALWATAITAATCASVALTAGMMLGAEAQGRDAHAARLAARSLAAEAMARANGAAADSDTAANLPASVDPRLALASALRTAEQSRSAQSAALQLADDRTDAMLSLLAAWPGDPATRVDDLRIDQRTVTIRGLVRDAGDAERLAAALAAGMTEHAEPSDARTRERWTVGAVQASRAAQGYTISIVLRPPSEEVTVAGRTTDP